jgi:hypothetical protein
MAKSTLSTAPTSQHGATRSPASQSLRCGRLRTDRDATEPIIRSKTTVNQALLGCGGVECARFCHGVGRSPRSLTYASWYGRRGQKRVLRAFAYHQAIRLRSEPFANQRKQRTFGRTGVLGSLGYASGVHGLHVTRKSRWQDFALHECRAFDGVMDIGSPSDWDRASADQPGDFALDTGNAKSFFANRLARRRNP